MQMYIFVSSNFIFSILSIIYNLSATIIYLIYVFISILLLTIYRFRSCVFDISSQPGDLFLVVKLEKVLQELQPATWNQSYQSYRSKILNRSAVLSYMSMGHLLPK